MTASPVVIPQQGSLDDLGTPLTDVTFCVIDLETTGTSAADCAITEVGAVKLRGGECLGTFQTLVDPGTGIPPSITILTGITEAMVVNAPPIAAVLPSLLEFLGDAVVVGHNIQFDLSFLKAAMASTGRQPLANRSVDTCRLARRLLRDEVPNCRLGTLATHLRLSRQPSHRALDDALATSDLLHLLLERAGALGVTGLEDLLVLPRMAGHAQVAKLRLTEDLPRKPGVYLFRGQRGEVLYVGRASNLRSRVRSYFSSDSRRKTAQLLKETLRIDHRTCSSPLEAAVVEVRLIHQHEPRFNQQGTTWRRYTYVKLSLSERFPRLSAARVVKDDRSLYLGPVSSTSTARRIIEAVETVVPLRRCTGRPGRTPHSGPCAPAQLGVATCPCTGDTSEEDYAAIVATAQSGLTDQSGLLLHPLADRMVRLAEQERFEEAADVRDRADALATAL
ncbi:MAG: DEDD exonuclease domain-containing protein, partial [Acidimicrobiales bacterium]|nr:DEDD exonuclease domain-containing protein [Acidimicrobiales bacterium]